MPEYVYALHDFLPEHEDEVTFHAGERIEVVEKDDLYGDGWWQGRNLLGKVGLFPVSYTAPVPPTASTLAQSAPSSSANAAEDSTTGTTPSKTVLQPLHEESESESPPTPDIASPVPKQPPAKFLNGDGYESDLGTGDDASLHLSTMRDGEVMKATMTDVQKAIEQLGRGAAGGEDGDGARSFSFASTRDGADTETDETDFDLSDVDGAAGGAQDGEDWHRNARAKLAAKARRAVAEAEKLEAMLASNDPSGARRALAPPIEVELSDESEDEGDFTRSSKFQRDHPYILEEDENDEAGSEPSHKKEQSSTATQRSSTIEDHNIIAPPRDETDVPTATAAQLSFPVFSPPPPVQQQTNEPTTTTNAERPVSPAKRNSYPSPTPPPLVMPVPSAVGADQNQKRNSVPAREAPPMDGLPSPALSSFPTAAAVLTNPNPNPNTNTNSNSKHDSIVSSSSAPQMTGLAAAPPVQDHHQHHQQQQQQQQQQQNDSPSSELKKTHPTEWSVEQVVEWLKSRGFDQDVCEKFIEQEITGDVLLELTVELLKTEIGIMAFGKRVRIANAIADLRRPPSIEYSDHLLASEQASPMHMHMHVSQPHSRTQSQSHSHRSFPGTGTGNVNVNPGPVGYAYAQSQQSSLGSPLGYHFAGNANGGANGNGYGNGYGYGSQFEAVQESPGPVGVAIGSVAAAAAAGVGLGIGLSSANSSPIRPTLLGPSPSDSALKDSAAKSSLTVPKAEDDDRGHMSDSEIPAANTSMRRRLFGRSQDSTASVLNSARQGSPFPSPSRRDTPDKEIRDKDSVRSSSKEGKEKEKESKEGKDKEGKEKEKDNGKEKDSLSRDSASIGSGRHARAKKSVDGAVKHDRLSIFGGTFAGTLGKSRKPPPSANEEPSEKSSKFTLPRLHGTGLRKASSTSQRPSTPNQSPKDLLHQDSPKNSDKDKDNSSSNQSQSLNLKNTNMLRKRTTSTQSYSPVVATHAGAAAATAAGAGEGAGAGTEETVNGVSGPIKQGQNILDQIGEPDHIGWMRKKGDRYNSWKLRYFILKGPHLYWLRSNSKTETRIKGYIHIVGYKVTVDENVDPGRYGFRIDHDHDKTHFFSSEEKTIVRDWMKAIMKATIGRDYTKPVVSSCNIPTIPLVVAQAMNPAPRPPSPSARDATQKALRREYPDQLSSRDARVLMGLPGSDAKEERARLDSFFSDDAMASNGNAANDMPPTPRRAAAPPRPSREMRRSASQRTPTTAAEDILIEWANSHLPEGLQITDPTGPLCGGLALLRLAESIKGRPSSPPVPDSAFPAGASDDKLDGLFRLFDFLLDNDVKMGSVSINDVRQGKRDKIVQLLRALKAWEDKRRALANTIAKGSMQAGAGFMVPVLS
ncbi:hypothetical protein CVT25_003904 [Psilocybe cyanescens]|uniref:Uncharacterized protein n=1 Tax=Psilocybe cyanescens TaxID=93625 RepID=A0A409XPQ6_PSICY|nr:hypothetical protein CVT25_003904 [Psilocybe cyanescens]